MEQSIQIKDISFDDQKTWDLLKSGQTKGVFQCESELVQDWLRKIKPRNLWELSAVIAIVRPGALKSGFADQYVENLNNPSSKPSFGHPEVDNILSVTNGIMLYQESLMQLGSRLAWPDKPELEKLQLVDKLRKGVGKKDQKKLLEIGREFVDGCIKNNLDKEIADKLFEIIKNCGRYLFNLAHSFSYAVNAYHTAWLKANYPIEFYAVYLSYAPFKLKKWTEIKEIVHDAKKHGLNILPPNINEHNKNFKIKDGNIVYGLSIVKFIGDSLSDKLIQLPRIEFWQDIIRLLFTDHYGFKVNSRSAIALIVTGAFSDSGHPRKTLFNIYNSLSELSPKELSFIIEKMDDYDDIKDIKTLLERCRDEVSMTKRKSVLETQIDFLDLDAYDNPAWLDKIERQYLGVNLTASAVEEKMIDAADSLIDCRPTDPNWCERYVPCVIEHVKLTETKKGQNPGQKMAIIDIYDNTCNMYKVPIFPKFFQDCEDLLVEGNKVQIQLKKSPQGDWFITRVDQL